MPLSPAYHPLQECLARIFKSQEAQRNTLCGAGVVVAERWVLTCAHVICIALGLLDPPAEKPDQFIELDFPLSGSTCRLSAKVIVWDPAADLAGLEILGEMPREVAPVRLRRVENLYHRPVEAFGFPKNRPHGGWADAMLRGPVTTGWIEIVATQLTGFYVQQGYSGGPVWDHEANCCIGIIVAADSDAGLRVSYLIPAEMIGQCWKEICIEQAANILSLQQRIQPLLRYLNRGAQDSSLQQTIEAYQPAKPLPLVYVVHGDDLQAHDMYLEKVKKTCIPRFLNCNPERTVVKSIAVEWPAEMRKIDDFPALFARKLADRILSNPRADCASIQKTLAGYEMPVIIHLHISTDEWMQFKGKILEAYFDFWQSWPGMNGEQYLFAFLFIEYKMPIEGFWGKLKYQSQKQRILARLNRFPLNTYTRLVGAILPELNSVSRTEAEDWVRGVACETCGNHTHRIIHEIHKLYGADKEKPMQIVTDKLESCLIACSESRR